MKLLLSYVKRHWPILFGGILAIFIFTMVFFAYSLPLKAVLYAVLLTAVCFGGIAFLRFMNYLRRHKDLMRRKESILISIAELPKPLDFIEEDYQTLLQILNKEHLAAVSHKDQLISDMDDYYTTWAHQIKTPIAAMSLILQNQREESLQNAELSEQLFRIEQYVEMVLGFIRSESIANDMVIRPYYLDDIIKQSVKKYSRQFIRRKLSFDYPGTKINALTDEKWFSFILEQLLMNALKYTEKGKISIRVYEETNGSCAISVSDTGIGIRPEDLPRIGEKGFTGYNGREDKKSTGIGLYLCRKIAGRLSHSFRIESELEKGTTVTIGNIPLVL